MVTREMALRGGVIGGNVGSPSLHLNLDEAMNGMRGIEISDICATFVLDNSPVHVIMGALLPSKKRALNTDAAR